MTESYSVIVPAFNAEHSIARCLMSVVAQTLKPQEVIVIDDDSSDGTSSEVERCAQALADQGIKLEYVTLVQNGGPAAARNNGILSATGSYFAFLDADDIWAQDKLSICDSYITSLRRPGLLCHTYTESPQLLECTAFYTRTAEELSVFRMLWRNPAQTSCAVMRADLGLAFDERMRYCEDHDLWMRIVESARVVRVLGRPLTQLGRPQLSPGGLSGNVVRMRLGEMRVFYNFCRRSVLCRMWLLPVLVLFSATKHVYSWYRRTVRHRGSAL